MSKRRFTLIAGAVFLLVLVTYLSLPTKNYYSDGIFFAEYIEEGRGPSLQLHPNHPLYQPFVLLIYKLLPALGASPRALQLMQILNGVFGALAVLMTLCLLRRLQRSPYVVLTLTCLFAFSAGWWRFSTDADAYVPSVTLLVISFYLALPANKPRPILAAIAFSLATAFHQLAVLAFPALAVATYFQEPLLSRRTKMAIRFSIAAVALTLGTYYLCFYLAAESLNLKRFAHFIMYHSTDMRFSTGIYESLRFTIFGNVRIFIGGRFNLLRGLFNPLTITLVTAFLILFCIWLFSSIYHFKELIASIRRLAIHRQFPAVAVVCIIWIFTYLVFLFIWFPFNSFYRLFYLPPIVTLVGVLAGRESMEPQPRRYRLAVFVAALSICNLLFLIYPYSHAEKYKPVAMALEMQRIWPPQTVVFYRSENTDVFLFRYLLVATNWRPIQSVPGIIPEDELKGIYAAGHQAWLEATAMDQLSSSADGSMWLTAHAVMGTEREILDTAYNIKFVQVVP